MTITRDPVLFLIAILLGLSAPAAAERDCEHTVTLDSTGAPLVPVDQMTESYVGQGGHEYSPGLYGDGQNEPTLAHRRATLAAAVDAAQPRHGDGTVCTGDLEDSANADCLVVVVGVSMSNGTQEWSGGGPDRIDPGLAFVDRALAHPDRSTVVRVVDLAQGGLQAQCLSGDDPTQCAPVQDGTDKFEYYWGSLIDQRLSDAGVTPAQVSVAWIKLANHDEQNPDHVAYLELNTVHALELLTAAFPNLRLGYLNSRIYGGYATEGNNEPVAYEQAFALRNVIVRQMEGDPELCFAGQDGCSEARVPVVDWGHYMWANGLTANSEGISWACDDLRESDGQHPSATGVDKVATSLLGFFASDDIARVWFAGDAAPDLGDEEPAPGDPCTGDCADQGDVGSPAGCSATAPSGGLAGLLLSLAALIGRRRRSLSRIR